MVECIPLTDAQLAALADWRRAGAGERPRRIRDVFPSTSPRDRGRRLATRRLIQYGLLVCVNPTAPEEERLYHLPPEEEQLAALRVIGGSRE